MAEIQDKDGEVEGEMRLRECDSSCSHFDHINQCCWQSGPWGLYFHVQEGDTCKLGYKEADS